MSRCNNKQISVCVSSKVKCPRRKEKKDDQDELPALMETQFFLAKMFNKNTTSADPDRAFGNLYSPINTIYVKTWAMNPSTLGNHENISLGLPLTPFRRQHNFILIHFNCLVVGETLGDDHKTGWARMRLTRDISPRDTLINDTVETVFSDEVFVEEPGYDNITGLSRAKYFTFTFKITPSAIATIFSRFYLAFSRIAPTNQPEYPGEIQFESMSLYYFREYNVNLPGLDINETI